MLGYIHNIPPSFLDPCPNPQQHVPFFPDQTVEPVISADWMTRRTPLRPRESHAIRRPKSSASDSRVDGRVKNLHADAIYHYRPFGASKQVVFETARSWKACGAPCESGRLLVPRSATQSPIEPTLNCQQTTVGLVDHERVLAITTGCLR